MIRSIIQASLLFCLAFAIATSAYAAEGCSNSLKAVDAALMAQRADTAPYVHIKGLYGDVYIYQEEGARFLLYDAGLKKNDPRGHWILEEVDEGSGYWILNRVTHEAWNIEGREGFVEVSPLEPTYVSFRWELVEEENVLRIRNLWQRSAYISIENTNTDKVQYDPFSPSWLSMKFQTEPVEEIDESISDE